MAEHSQINKEKKERKKREQRTSVPGQQVHLIGVDGLAVRGRHVLGGARAHQLLDALQVGGRRARLLAALARGAVRVRVAAARVGAAHVRWALAVAASGKQRDFMLLMVTQTKIT